MDAVEFVKQLRRMDRCEGKKYFVFDDTDSPEDVVAEVEKWVKEHPLKTRQSVFLERWPETSIDEDGMVCICPANISSHYRGLNGGCGYLSTKCSDCRKEFWGQEVE